MNNRDLRQRKQTHLLSLAHRGQRHPAGHLPAPPPRLAALQSGRSISSAGRFTASLPGSRLQRRVSAGRLRRLEGGGGRGGGYGKARCSRRRRRRSRMETKGGERRREGRRRRRKRRGVKVKFLPAASSCLSGQTAALRS